MNPNTIGLTNGAQAPKLPILPETKIKKPRLIVPPSPIIPEWRKPAKTRVCVRHLPTAVVPGLLKIYPD